MTASTTQCHLQTHPTSSLLLTCMCSVLLTVLRCAVTSPFQRLPAVHALVCAEAALTALHPGCPMYLPVNKYLLRRAVMDLEVSYAVLG